MVLLMIEPWPNSEATITVWYYSKSLEFGSLEINIRSTDDRLLLMVMKPRSQKGRSVVDKSFLKSENNPNWKGDSDGDKPTTTQSEIESNGRIPMGMKPILRPLKVKTWLVDICPTPLKRPQMSCKAIIQVLEYFRLYRHSLFMIFTALFCSKWTIYSK